MPTIVPRAHELTLVGLLVLEFHPTAHGASTSSVSLPSLSHKPSSSASSSSLTAATSLTSLPCYIFALRLCTAGCAVVVVI